MDPAPTDAADAVVPPPPATTGASRAAQAYQGAVAEIMESRRPDAPYPASAPNLTVTAHHRPRTEENLAPAELVQLRAAWGGAEGMTLAQALADEEFDIEAAEIVDENGTLRYRLYAWNFGVGYLFPPEGLDIVAFAAQHDLEHWSVRQRDLFAGMDRAMRGPDHGFQQPLHFCWAEDSCWDEIAGAAPGTVRSEPHLREMLARAAISPSAG